MTEIAEWDLRVFEWFNGFAGKNKALDWTIIFFARYYTLVMPLGVMVYLQLSRGPLSFKHLVLNQVLVLSVSRGIFTELIRIFYRRKRPYLSHRVKQLLKKYAEASFPSGHTISIVAMGIALAHFNPGAGWFVAISGLVIGLARIMAGLHYPLDVLAGLVLSLPAAYLGNTFYYFFIR